MTSASRPATPSICWTPAASLAVTERAAYIGRVRALAKACCEAWLQDRQGAYKPGSLWPNLLLELFSEEIPARMQARAARTWSGWWSAR